ncbi:hypothetical protein J6590_073068 [Homalodisca vitripennis]|nr:hypothetical protein J6590_073068 [Homalodisca vitripennis]
MNDSPQHYNSKEDRRDLVHLFYYDLSHCWSPARLIYLKNCRETRPWRRPVRYPPLGAEGPQDTDKNNRELVRTVVVPALMVPAGPTESVHPSPPPNTTFDPTTTPRVPDCVISQCVDAWRRR